MRRNPLFIFQGLDSVGIYDVPLKSTVHVINIGLDADGMPVPMFMQLVAKVGLDATSTIRDLLPITEDYIDLFTVGEVYSELELIAEEDHIGWRILNRDPVNYAKIGVGAFDFSFSEYQSVQMGASGDYSAAWGQNTMAAGPYSTANGNTTTAGYPNQFVIGTRNYNKAMNIFEVGIGVPLAAANAFEVTKDGILSAPEMDPSQITEPRTLITKEYLENNVAGGGQLREVEENGNHGYRIFGRDSMFYKGTGEEAVDLSYSTMYSNAGAAGNYSFTAGYNVLQKNDSGTALGEYNDNKDDTLFEIGNGASYIAKTNALEVYKDGSIIAPSLSVTDIVDARSLVTKEYLQGISVGYLIVDADITDNLKVETWGISNAVIDYTEVFANGILLRPGRDYIITDVISPPGVTVTFDINVTNYGLYAGDWVKIKAPVVL